MKAACLGLLLACLCWGQASRPAEPIAGRVVHALSGEELAGVRVVLSLAERRDRELASVIADRNGRFQFMVERGRYHLVAESHELGRQAYGTRGRMDVYSVAIIVNGEDRHDKLELKMYPAGAIAGQVVDNHGEPVEDALVQLLRSITIGGKKRLSIRGYDRTDDRGQYRFGNLSAGNYYLVVGGTPWHNKSTFVYPNRQEQPGTAYLPIYYPNTQNPAAAAPLALAASGELRADFTLVEGTGSTIRVKSSGDVDGIPRVDLIAEGIAGLNRFQFVGNLYSGENRIPAVPPGKYRLKVSGTSKGKPVEGSVAVEAGYAEQSVTVNLAPLPTVSGKMMCEGKPIPAGTRMLVAIWDPVANRGSNGWIQADGTFSVSRVEPGKKIVIVAFANACYPSRVLLGGKELQGNAFEVGSEPITGLTIDGTRGVAEVKGFVRKNEAKHEGAFVLLTPVQELVDPELYKSFKTDSDGSFDFQAVRPGEYWLYAVDVEDFEYANRAVIAPYLRQAKKIVVPAFGKLTQDLEVIEPK